VTKRPAAACVGLGLNVLVFGITVLGAVTDARAEARELRVCADPNNLPFSNQAKAGFENQIMSLVAQDLGASITYTWWAQRRGYVRNTLQQDLCDVWPGVAAGVNTMATTHPYYRSTYVFVSRADEKLGIASFDDARLRRLTIGVQMIGADAANSPPSHALARRGVTANVRGYMLYGDYGEQNPAAAIIDEVARGAVDLAVVWGPTAGFFAARNPVRLVLIPVEPASDGPQWPMTFAIAMGVRKNDAALLEKLDLAIGHRQHAIDAVLKQYGVPLIGADADTRQGRVSFAHHH
jgi:mxaJ protein